MMKVKLQFFIWCIVFGLSIADNVPSIADPSGEIKLNNTDTDTDRIVGGYQADQHEFPFIVTLTNRFEFCSGVLIHPRWVLTAAHCGNYPSVFYRVTANAYDIKEPSGEEVKVRVSRIYKHPSYDPQTGANDIALVKLSSYFTLDQNVKAIPLAPQNFQASGEGTAAGWGLESEDAKGQPNIIRKVEIPIVANPECKKFYDEAKNSSLRLNVEILDTMLCAGKVGYSSCYGDSGGPFLCSNGSDKYGYLCGIVSSGKKCGDLGIYTRVSAYRDWIASMTNNDVEA